MSTNRFQHYLEAEVLCADPVKLVHMLYRGALEAVCAAHRALLAGNIPERTRQINKAWEIVRELLRSLDRSKGGDLGRNLAELYVYIQNRLIEANAQQSGAPLAEAERLLTTLCEAWKSIELRSAASPAEAPEHAYEPVSCQA
jgi:flagellar protein FliS